MDIQGVYSFNSLKLPDRIYSAALLAISRPTDEDAMYESYVPFLVKRSTASESICDPHGYAFRIYVGSLQSCHHSSDHNRGTSKSSRDVVAIHGRVGQARAARSNFEGSMLGNTNNKKVRALQCFVHNSERSVRSFQTQSLVRFS